MKAIIAVIVFSRNLYLTKVELAKAGIVQYQPLDSEKYGIDSHGNISEVSRNYDYFLDDLRVEKRTEDGETVYYDNVNDHAIPRYNLYDRLTLVQTSTLLQVQSYDRHLLSLEKIQHLVPFTVEQITII